MKIRRRLLRSSETHDIIAKEVAVKAIPECSIVFVEGKEMKTMLSGYLNTLARAESGDRRRCSTG